MKLEKEQVGEAVVIKPGERRLDASIAREFRESLGKVVEVGHCSIVLDLSAVEFVDSTGLGAIVSVLKMVGDDGEIVISGAKATVMSIFKLTRMDKVFRIVADVPAAIGSFAE